MTGGGGCGGSGSIAASDPPSPHAHVRHLRIGRPIGAVGRGECPLSPDLPAPAACPQTPAPPARPVDRAADSAAGSTPIWDALDIPHEPRFWDRPLGGKASKAMFEGPASFGHFDLAQEDATDGDRDLIRARASCDRCKPVIDIR